MGYFDLAILQEEKKREQKEKNQIFYLLSLIADIYQHNLLTPVGQEVLNYLRQERHLDKTTINRFGLGCSINNRQLSRLLLDQKNADFSSEDLLATNLVWITDQNQTCDFFPAHHLIIPLANTEGKVVAFAARKVGEISADEGKYKYLPSYQYYQKSALLYNYSIVKKNRVEECYLVEGFFDVISLSKLEIKNCLALLGTNLSEEQIKLLLGLKKRIILFLDNDKAGQEATVNVAIKLLEREIDCEVVKNDYPGDPDEICRQQSQESIQILLHTNEEKELLRDAQPVVKIILAIISLEKKIAEKEKVRKVKSEKDQDELKKLKSELEKKNQELAEIDQEKLQKGINAILGSEELNSEGVLSLLKAMEKFDLNTKFRFATYAGCW
ncbi:13185_t:CDS:2, partial [Racocetra persica]